MHKRINNKMHKWDMQTNIQIKSAIAHLAIYAGRNIAEHNISSTYNKEMKCFLSNMNDLFLKIGTILSQFILYEN